ncbi:hypothetical protein KJI95_09340 [Shewanella sp. JM162201]|uniref:Lipoprotein n=1 Tax=Shewanella jiangmenensis TaxID=2837387 RepID=A0ABS5V2P6_9GAMM|nr:hypothetical protein [Shewanella jiangmenensis]MBT1444723.1 hypothetical protein [Shewanella jiangmenensis]
MMNKFRPLLAAALSAVVITALPGCQTPPPPKKAVTAPVQDAVMWQLFTLNTKAPFVLNVPDTKVRSKLSEFVELGGHSYVKGQFEDGPVRGEVLLRYKDLQPLNASFRGLKLLIAPFMVANQGSGSFWYLGLYGLNEEKRAIGHLDSIFIGDRVDIRSFSPSDHAMLPVLVNGEVLVHAPGQPMAEPPRLMEIRRYEISWDGKILSLD